MIQINGLKDHVTKILERNIEISLENYDVVFRQCINNFFIRLEPEIKAVISEVLSDMTSMLKHTMSEIRGCLTGEEALMLCVILNKSPYTPDIPPRKFLLGCVADYMKINGSFNCPDDPSLSVYDKVKTLTEHQSYALIIATYNGFESGEEQEIIAF